jgi:hypothetical protein
MELLQKLLQETYLDIGFATETMLEILTAPCFVMTPNGYEHFGDVDHSVGTSYPKLALY